MESNSVCNHASDKQNQTTAKQESDLSITSMITDRIGRHEVLLPINHNRYNFCKKQIHLGQKSPVEKKVKEQNSSISEILLFFFSMSGCCYGYFAPPLTTLNRKNVYSDITGKFYYQRHLVLLRKCC